MFWNRKSKKSLKWQSPFINLIHECYEAMRRDMLWNVTLSKLIHIRHNNMYCSSPADYVWWRFPSLTQISQLKVLFHWLISQQVATVWWPRTAWQTTQLMFIHGGCKMKESVSSLKSENMQLWFIKSAKQFAATRHNFSTVLLMWKLDMPLVITQRAL